MLFTPIFNQTLVFFLLILLGFVLVKCKFVPEGTDKAISSLEKNVFLPALVLGTFIKQCTVDTLVSSWKLLLVGALFGVVVIPVSIAIIRALFKTEDSRKIGTYALIFSNFGYMGNAMIIAVFPDVFFEYTIFTLPLTVIMYVWGIPALLLNDGKARGLKSRLKTLVNPMLICMLLGMLFGLSGLNMPAFITTAIDSASACMSPLAMILTGMVIAKIDLLQFLKKWRIYVFVAIKVIVYPLVFLVIFYFIPQNSLITPTLLICAACYMSMPTGLNPIVLPVAYGKDVSEAAGMAFISHLVGVLTIPLTFMLLQNFLL